MQMVSVMYGDRNLSGSQEDDGFGVGMRGIMGGEVIEEDRGIWMVADALAYLSI